jgi:hypothetical protein
LQGCPSRKKAAPMEVRPAACGTQLRAAGGQSRLTAWSWSGWPSAAGTAPTRAINGCCGRSMAVHGQRRCRWARVWVELGGVLSPVLKGMGDTSE